MKNRENSVKKEARTGKYKKHTVSKTAGSVEQLTEKMKEILNIKGKVNANLKTESSEEMWRKQWR